MLYLLLSLSNYQLFFMIFFLPMLHNLKIIEKIIENIFCVKNPINLEKCKRQWIGCYNLFEPIFYLQDKARKQIELCSLLENWCCLLSIL